jgi:hypothetical protein
MPRIDIDETTIVRTDGAPTTGEMPEDKRPRRDRGHYSVTKTDARGRATTTEFSYGGAELLRYEGEPRDVSAEAKGA